MRYYCLLSVQSSKTAELHNEWSDFLVLDTVDETHPSVVSPPSSSAAEHDDPDGSDATPDVGGEGEELESVIYVEQDHIDAQKFKTVEKTWSNGDAVPFEAMFVSPSLCQEATLTALLSHSEFSTRMDADDAATANQDDRFFKLKFF